MTEQHESLATAGPTRFTLPAQAGIRIANELRAWSIDALAADGEVEIVCADVERVDAAVLQCLMALASDLDRLGRRLALTEVPPGVERAIEAVGFETTLLGAP